MDIKLPPGNTGLKQINGASSPCATFDYDVSVDTILYPSTSIICENPISPIVTLVNFGQLSLTSVDINIEVDGTLVQTFGWTENLATSASENLTLPTNSNTTIEIYSSSPNGNTDENSINDAKSYSTAYYLPQNLPFTIDFAGNLPVGTFVSNPDADAIEWGLNANLGGFSASMGSIMVDNFSNDRRGTKVYLSITPVNLSGNSDYQLIFDVAYARFDNSFFDGL